MRSKRNGACRGGAPVQSQTRGRAPPASTACGAKRIDSEEAFVARVCKTERDWWVYWARLDWRGKPWAKKWRFRCGPYRHKWRAVLIAAFLPNGRLG